jgi:hypothetical protein
VFGGRALRNGRTDAADTGNLSVRPGVIAIVTHSRPRRDVGAKIEQCLEERAVAGLTTGQAKENEAVCRLMTIPGPDGRPRIKSKSIARAHGTC